MKKLGRLEAVDVRELWNHEQYDFSNWLAKDENIELLNEVLGLTFVDIEKEVFVGSYRCDLVERGGCGHFRGCESFSVNLIFKYN